MFPTWDEGLGMLYVVGRGDSSIKYWEYQDGKLHFINSFNSMTPGKVQDYNHFLRVTPSSLSVDWMSSSVRS